MKKIFSGIIAGVIVTVFLGSASAQEQILPLSFNPVIAHKPIQPSTLRTALSLPFFDDFSYQTSYPDPNKWVDRQAFVNLTFPVDPPTFGVATLDGLKENGQPYDSIGHTFFSIGGADTLTSQPILLGGNSPADSVYFSFFFQPGGLGDEPNSDAFNNGNFSLDAGDSLVLEFKDNSDTTWQHIWAHDGTNNGINLSLPFQQVLIPLTNPIFFHDDFQFRFRNYATLIGQYDCWNIDYVKLDAGRTFQDVTLLDVAIQYLPTSILKNYQAMPWNQFQDFQDSEKAAQQFVTVRNNQTNVYGQNTNFNRVAYEAVTNTPLDPLVSVSNNVPALSSFTNAFDVLPIQNFSLDSVNVVTKFFIGGVPGDHRNDTLARNQIFSNYMAYDDGTPEAVYRLLGSPASLALQFHLNQQDTLRGVEILFAHTEVNLTPNLFNLFVWRSLDPEDTLLRDEFLTPQFQNEMNGFTFYRLSRPLAITDTFYIGWQQVSLQSDLKMDVGLDLNDSSDLKYLWYNVDGYWNQSLFPAAVMMRPVLGESIPFGIGIPPVNEGIDDFIIFPNPASDMLYASGGSNHLLLQAFDISGKAITAPATDSKLEIRNLPAGMYLLRIADLRTGKTSVQKFVKAAE
ncbi:MAG TPA: T9SS type A sorting domain-containing protein [Chitinophagales bacterium]|nr:T9SS type A sorting domain-containing protein [Chitinophagales bacterium]